MADEVMYTLAEGIDELTLIESEGGISYYVVIYSDGTGEVTVIYPNGNKVSYDVVSSCRVNNSRLICTDNEQFVFEV